jgi:hypothetical protein
VNLLLLNNIVLNECIYMNTSSWSSVIFLMLMCQWSDFLCFSDFSGFSKDFSDIAFSDFSNAFSDNSEIIY